MIKMAISKLKTLRTDTKNKLIAPKGHVGSKTISELRKVGENPAFSVALLPVLYVDRTLDYMIEYSL